MPDKSGHFGVDTKNGIKIRELAKGGDFDYL
jgi:hypothetical protein